MSRRNDWQRLLFAEISRHGKQPFAYGRCDCWTLANECVRAMTGKPLIAGIRYRSAVGARRVLRNRGHADLADVLVTSGLAEIPPVMAQRGDIGVTAGIHGEPALVICVGAQWAGKALAPAEGGLIHIPRSRVLKAYRVE